MIEMAGWILTPVHIVLSDSAAKKELKREKLDIEQLPWLKYGDAALVKLREEGSETEIGSVVRIERTSEVGGEGYAYYRKIVP
jgi:DNA-directed RNA polymerase subunit H (RpoH/RPB5)